MKRVFAINLAIGLVGWALFYLCLFALNGFTTSGTHNFPLSLVPLVLTLMSVAFILTPVNNCCSARPRCGVFAVLALQGYFGALSLSLFSWRQVGNLSLVQLLLNPFGILLYTFPYVFVIAVITVIVFTPYYRRLFEHSENNLNP